MEEKYSSHKIQNASQHQIEQMFEQFKHQQVSIYKLAGFLTYNIVALFSVAKFTNWYINSTHIKKDEPRRLDKRQLSIFKVAKKGTKYGIMLSLLYACGFVLIGSYAMPISVFKKYCELQQAKNFFSIRFDPFYQEILLYRKMRKFGLSDSLIEQIKSQLNCKKENLIKEGMLKTQTIKELQKAQEYYKQNMIEI